MSIRTAAFSAVVVLGLALAGCGGSSHKTSTSPSGGCAQVSQPKSRSESRKPPTGGLDPSKTWTASVDTKDSPHTTASFASLARSGFYDDTTFHRIVPGFVIQGGDPTATGSGGPGYSVVDLPPRTAKYTLGTVAMAKTRTEPPGAAGSQFFVVTGADAGLPPDYALLGKVTKGMAVVDAIGQLGDPNTEQPTQVVVVRRITVSGS